MWYTRPMAEYLFPLRDRKEVADGTMAFWFDTSQSSFAFEAGQNADLTLIDPPFTDAEGNTRTFSFASSPHHKERIMFATRMRATAFKNSLKSIPLGTPVKVIGPNGNMLLHQDAKRPAVMIAGGIGITPFRSMIEWATAMRLPHRITLLYSNRNPSAAAFMDDLESWRRQHQNFRLVATVTESHTQPWSHESGRIDERFIRAHVPDMHSAVFYLAGPDAMVSAMRTLVLDLGVGPDDIRLESFSGY